MSPYPLLFTTYYEQGPVAGTMSFRVRVRNGSDVAQVAFRAQEASPAGVIELPPSPLDEMGFSARVEHQVEASYSSAITLFYWPGEKGILPDPSDFGLEILFVDPREPDADVEARTTDEDPRLILNVALQNAMINNTAQIGVSYEISAPVLNSLDLLIQNPSDRPVLSFENVGELGPDDPLPSLDEPYVGPRLDRLYVYFPYGTTQGTLTDKTLAASITLSPGPENNTWDVVKQSSPDVGTNWILFPKLQALLRPNESVAFRFTGIQSFNPPSLTHLRMKKQVQGYEVETDTSTQLALIDAQPRILSFEPSQNLVTAGTTVEFSWNTWGAKTCSFGSQQGLAGSVAAYPVFVLVGNTYRLDAISASNKSTSEHRTVNVLPVQVSSFLAEPAAGWRQSEPVTLKWLTSSAVTVEVQPEVGVVCEDAAGCNAGEAVVYPTSRTVYRLTATGGTSTERRELIIFPLPKGWQKTTSAAPWSTVGRPVLLGYGGQLVFLAGGAPANYSSLDGAVWRTVSNNSPWGKRTQAGGAVFNGGDGEKMWVLGGQDGSTVFAEVYQSSKPEGSGFASVTTSPGWAARANMGCIVFAGKLWVVGGTNGQGGGFNDLWSSANGKDWTQVTPKAGWSPRWAFGLAVFENRLWVFGGQLGADPGDVTNEVWSSVDGITWKKWPTPPWTPRSYANAQVFSDGRLFLFGGARTATVAADDLWRLRIRTESGQETLEWVQLPTQAMGNSAGMGCTLFAGGAWLAGGFSTPGSVPGPNKSVWLYAPVPL